MTIKPSIFSFFSGVGFLDLGFESAGFKIDFVNEIHKPFLDGYRYSRHALKLPPPEYGYHQADIVSFLEASNKKVLQQWVRSARKKSDIVGFIGGPPCPDFSIGGKNRGAEGENGKLSSTYVELICQQKPDFFMFENVKGLWNTKRHREFFEEIKNKTHDNGFITTERLINAIEYGAPQDRDRIILFGFQKNLLTDLGLFKKSAFDEKNFHWTKKAKYVRDKVLTMPWPTISPFSESSKLSCPENIVKELTVEYWFQKNQVTGHPNSEHCFKPQAGLKRFEAVDEGDDSRKSFKRLHRWRYSPTACYGNNEVHLHPYKPRRINAAEALSIQSLPKDFVLPSTMTLTDMFKAIGNGVPFLAARGLARTAESFLNCA